MSIVDKAKQSQGQLVPQRMTGIGFNVGNCQYCGYLPMLKEVHQDKDNAFLFHCPRCGFPMEFVSLLAFVDRFHDDMDKDAQLLESYYENKEHVVR